MKNGEAKRIRRQAAEWLALRQASGFTPADERGFAAWCESDPRHRWTFSQLESVWEKIGRLAEYPNPEESAANADFFTPRRAPLRLLRPALLAAAAGIMIGMGIWFEARRLPKPDSAPSLATVESRFLALPDGSEVELHSVSKVVEQFTPAERRVHLAQGEAQFSVAKNPARPFVVEAGGVVVRALGTAFDVRLSTSAVEILVTEGKVEVNRSGDEGDSPQTQAGRGAVLVAGQRAIVRTNPGAALAEPVVETLGNSDIDRELAWQTGRLVFDATPLSEIVARINRLAADRRGATQLSLGDANAGNIRVSGRIRSDDIESFLGALQSEFGVSIEHRPDGQIVLSSQPRDSR